MRLFNNTSYKELDTQSIFDGIKHYLYAVNDTELNGIESIEVTDKVVTIIGNENSDNQSKCITFKRDCKTRVVGKIRWFNESSGEGIIRLESGKSVHFYSCNVIGADSMYQHLVTNVQFVEGQDVVAKISPDNYLFESLGLIDVKAVLHE